ncbi:MAG: acylphosphatase [Verrucomicrobiota bacterium]
MTAKQVYYEGRVQGVGFRYTTKQIAMGYDLSGWVRNLADGRVALQISGEEKELEAFLQEIRESVLGGHIRKEESETLTSSQPEPGFHIKH